MCNKFGYYVIILVTFVMQNIATIYMQYFEKGNKRK